MDNPETCTACHSVLYRFGDTREVSSSRALLALSAAVEHAAAAHRFLPDIKGRFDSPAVRMRQDAQYYLSDAGRSLGKAYDCLRVLAKIINETGGPEK